MQTKKVLGNSSLAALGDELVKLAAWFKLEILEYIIMRINSIWHPLVYSLISYIIIYVSTKMEFKRANILKFAFLLVVSVQLC